VCRAGKRFAEQMSTFVHHILYAVVHNLGSEKTVASSTNGAVDLPEIFTYFTYFTMKLKVIKAVI